MNKRNWPFILWGFCKENLLSMGIFIAVMALLFQGLQSAQAGSDGEGLRIAEQSIARAVVSCYAIEGSYPESYAYLVENYGLQIDTDKYQVNYMVFASNIMPTVTVIEVAP